MVEMKKFLLVFVILSAVVVFQTSAHANLWEIALKPDQDVDLLPSGEVGVDRIKDVPGEITFQIFYNYTDSDFLGTALFDIDLMFDPVELEPAVHPPSPLPFDPKGFKTSFPYEDPQSPPKTYGSLWPDGGALDGNMFNIAAGNPSDTVFILKGGPNLLAEVTFKILDPDLENGTVEPDVWIKEFLPTENKGMFEPDGNILQDQVIGAVDITVVPIPGALWLLGSGLLGLAALRRRFR
jgi:hypothetical protein